MLSLACVFFLHCHCIPLCYQESTARLIRMLASIRLQYEPPKNVVVSNTAAQCVSEYLSVYPRACVNVDVYVFVCISVYECECVFVSVCGHVRRR